MSDQQSTGVMLWWASLCVISAINICAWLADAIKGKRAVIAGGSTSVAVWRLQLVLSALFVIGCAFRSVLPRAEGQRICLYDSWLSNAFLGRTVATVAELSLVAQWTLVLREYAKGVGLKIGITLSRFLLPMIAVAEIFSWYTTITTNFIGSVFEESLWAATASLVAMVLIWVWQRSRRAAPRPFSLQFLTAAIALNVAYVVFMCTVDVPMYLARFRSDQARGVRHLTVAEGWRDSQTRRIVTRRWEDWRQEIPWMSLYFSAGVWISIALCRAPVLAKPAGVVGAAIGGDTDDDDDDGGLTEAGKGATLAFIDVFS